MKEKIDRSHISLQVKDTELRQQYAEQEEFIDERFIFSNEITPDFFHCVFKQYKEYKNVSTTYEDEIKFANMFKRINPVSFEEYAIVKRSKFIDNWRKYTSKMFENMDWTNIVCGDFAVVECLHNFPINSISNEILLFIYGFRNDDERSFHIIKNIVRTICKNTNLMPQFSISNTNELVLILPYPYKKVKIVLSQYVSINEILISFDVDSASVIFDGINVFASWRFKRAITRRYNTIDPTRVSAFYEDRLYLYSLIGFDVVLEKEILERLDEKITGNETWQSHGVAKLFYHKKYVDQCNEFSTNLSNYQSSECIVLSNDHENRNFINYCDEIERFIDELKKYVEWNNVHVYEHEIDTRGKPLKTYYLIQNYVSEDNYFRFRYYQLNRIEKTIDFKIEDKKEKKN